ncbi:hypothetical protein GCM10022419_096100 [Nonomuraea rosea]|uniref:Uncharacterized protein n=1 Tax=Nonomuraea rosea TaxID=638574 RepID=A0ABP6Z373_9ACTN
MRRGSGGSGTFRTAGSSGVSVYWHGPLVVRGGLSAPTDPPADPPADPPTDADDAAGIAPIAISEPAVTADNAARAASRTNALPDIRSSAA